MIGRPAMRMAAVAGARRRGNAVAAHGRWTPVAMRWKRAFRVALAARQPAVAAAFALSLAQSLHLHFHSRLAWAHVGAASRDRVARDAGGPRAQQQDAAALAPPACMVASPAAPHGRPMTARRDSVARMAANRAPRARVLEPQAPARHEPAPHPFALPSRLAPMARAALSPSRLARTALHAPEERVFARRATRFGALATPPAQRLPGAAPASTAPPAKAREAAPLARPAELYWPRLDPSHLDAAIASPGRARAASAPGRAGFDAAARSANATAPAAAAAPAPAPAAPLLDHAAIDRLAEDVIRRVERHVRIERERRGL
jgi:hypothetical protein